uniref:Uncharacterized protein n=1 Tax=Glossina brevipalpis TaxID=37001 RepID=A0A1A9X054_9MUSC
MFCESETESSAYKSVGLIKRLDKNYAGKFPIDTAQRIYEMIEKVCSHNQIVLDHFRSKKTIMYMYTHVYPELTEIISVNINHSKGLRKKLDIFVEANIRLRSNVDISNRLNYNYHIYDK